MRKHLTIATISFAFVLVGCGNQMSEEESQEAWGTTQQTLSSGEAQVQGDVKESSSDSPNTDASLDYTCPEGGSATFEGEYTYTSSDDEGSSTDKFEADMTVDYRACENNDIVIDGAVNYNLKTETSGDSFKYVYDWDGDLDYSGDVNGSCRIDMTGEMNFDSSSVSWNYSGTVCGHDAEQTLESSSGSINYDF